jgi:hypothetical protein
MCVGQTGSPKYWLKQGLKARAVSDSHIAIVAGLNSFAEAIAVFPRTPCANLRIR